MCGKLTSLMQQQFCSACREIWVSTPHWRYWRESPDAWWILGGSWQMEGRGQHSEPFTLIGREARNGEESAEPVGSSSGQKAWMSRSSQDSSEKFAQSAKDVLTNVTQIQPDYRAEHVRRDYGCM